MTVLITQIKLYQSSKLTSLQITQISLRTNHPNIALFIAAAEHWQKTVSPNRLKFCPDVSIT